MSSSVTVLPIWKEGGFLDKSDIPRKAARSNGLCHSRWKYTNIWTKYLLAETSTIEQEKHFYHHEQQDSSEVNEHKNTEEESSFINQINVINGQPEITYKELDNFILSLNTEQGKIFNAVHDWSR